MTNFERRDKHDVPYRWRDFTEDFKNLISLLLHRPTQDVVNTVHRRSLIGEPITEKEFIKKTAIKIEKKVGHEIGLRK